MPSNSTILDSVSRVVARHLPTSAASLEDKLDDGLRTYSDFWASKLISSDIHDLESFGLSKDIDKLEELERALGDVDRLCHEISPTARRDIQNGSILHWQSDSNEAIVDALVEVRSLRQSVSEVRKRERLKRRAGKKRNWRAVSVVHACREVWAVEEHRANPSRYDFTYFNALLELTLSGERREAARRNRIQYQDHVRNFAPRTEHNDRPGPFGKFVEDVFSVLGIMSKRNPEEAVRAASALASLRAVEREVSEGV